MSALLRKTQWGELWLKLAEHLRTPLYRNGYALIASSVITSGIGFFYWIIAARKYPAELVGINSTLISTMTFLANLGMLNLGNVLVRFVPTAGRRTPRLVLLTYVISLGVAAIVGWLFLYGQAIWAPTLSILRTNRSFGLWFVGSTLAWCIFALQDTALIGLRQAVWVPLENMFFALVKVGLLIVLAQSAPTEGIFLSWTIPVILVVPVMNVLIFSRLIPIHIRDHSAVETPLNLGRSAWFAGSDYVGSLILIAVNNLLPLLILDRVGAAAAAYFYLAWTIAYTLYLVTTNMCTSLIAEAAADEARLNVYSYKALIQILRLVVPVVILVELGAPLLLRLFGQAYSDEATTLLRLLCLSAIPNVVTTLYVNIQRVRVRMSAVVTLTVVLCGMVVVQSYALLGLLGITGVGVAWLVSQSVVAIVLLLTEMRPLWLSRLNLAPIDRFRQQIGAVLHGRPQRAVQQIDSHIADLICDIRFQSELEESTRWNMLGSPCVDKDDDICIFLGLPGQPAAAVVKLSGSPASARALSRHQAAVKELARKQGLGQKTTLLPRLLAYGALGNRIYVAETLIPGVNGAQALSQGAPMAEVVRNASAAIGSLHQATSRTVEIDSAILDDWVDAPITRVRTALHRPLPGSSDALDRLGDELKSALRGKSLSVSWIHGNFVPENFLIDPTTREVTGIVDWGLARNNALSQIDLAWLIMGTRIHMRHQELGSIVLDLITDKDGGWTDLEHEVLTSAASAQEGSALPTRPLVLLTWLHHVSSNLAKAEYYTGSWFWFSRNIESVLFYL